MGNMSDLVSNEQLDSIGNVLALEDGHKLKVADIKRLTRATKVKKLRKSEVFTLDDYVINLLRGAATHRSGEKKTVADVYYVIGDKVASTMLNMQTDKVVATITLKKSNVKKLHNACAVLERISEAKWFIDKTKEMHDRLHSAIEKEKIKSDFAKRTKKLDAVIKDYALQESKSRVAIIDALLKSTW